MAPADLAVPDAVSGLTRPVRPRRPTRPALRSAIRLNSTAGCRWSNGCWHSALHRAVLRWHRRILRRVYGFFAVLFTGRWPRGAFDYWSERSGGAYRVIAYFHLMTDAYRHSRWPTTQYPLASTSTTPSTSKTGGRSCNGCWQFHISGRRRPLLADRRPDSRRVLHRPLHPAIPRGVFELTVPGLRWNLRGNAYAYFTNGPVSALYLGITGEVARLRTRRGGLVDSPESDRFLTLPRPALPARSPSPM